MDERPLEPILPARAARMWLAVVRPFSFTASVVPVLLGTVVAGGQGFFSSGLLLLTLIAAVAIQGVGVAGAYFYSGQPLAYKYRALGDPIIFLLFGPLAVLGAYFVQAGAIELVPVLYALPVGCLVTAILHVNNIRDMPFDGRDGGVTVARTLGLRGSKVLLYSLLAAAYVLVFAGDLLGTFVRWSALTLLSAPMAWNLARRIHAAAEPRDLVLLDVATARLHLVFGLLLVLGVLL